jgi:hypothetical protein
MPRSGNSTSEIQATFHKRYEFYLNNKTLMHGPNQQRNLIEYYPREGRPSV